MNSIFFDSGESLLRTAILAVCSYAALVVLVRISGKRTLSKMNTFDFLVTIALGSALATVLLSKDTSLVQGVVAFSALIGCQFAVSWSSVRWRWVHRWVTGEPQMLLYQGEYIDSALRKSRVTKEDVLAAIRAAGIADRGSVQAVVLETDASLSVIEAQADGSESTLEGIRSKR